jgi:hypothetical protein
VFLLFFIVYLLYLMCFCCILCVFVVSYVFCCILCVFVVSYVYLLYLIVYLLYLIAYLLYLMCICCTMCIAVSFVLFWMPDSWLEVSIRKVLRPATSTQVFSWFPCVYKQILRWFQRFQFATTCFSCSPPELNLVVTDFIFCINVN